VGLTIPVGYTRVSPDSLGTLTLLVSDFVVPMGLAFRRRKGIFSDINDRRAWHIRGFDLFGGPNGLLTLAKTDGTGYSGPARGPTGAEAPRARPVPGRHYGSGRYRRKNVYCGGLGGLYILDAKGKKASAAHRPGPDGHHPTQASALTIEDTVSYGAGVHLGSSCQP